MKVAAIDPEFSPIEIIVETYAEAEKLWRILNHWDHTDAFARQLWEVFDSVFRPWDVEVQEET